MGKLYLNYKKHNSNLFGEFLKVKIDEKITTEIKENEISEFELPNGVHNIKMYIEGWQEDDLAGYVDCNIDIQDNTYYVYEMPKTLMGKGKFVQKNVIHQKNLKKQ